MKITISLIPYTVVIVTIVWIGVRRHHVPVAMILGYAFILGGGAVFNAFLVRHFLLNLLVWCPGCAALAFAVTMFDIRRGHL